MCIIIISICHRYMLATTPHPQNKSYSESIRQYARRRTKALFPSAYLFIKILNDIRKLYHIQEDV